MHSSTGTSSHQSMGSTSSTSTTTSTQKPYEPLTPQSPEPPSSTRHSQDATRVADSYEPAMQQNAATPNTTVDPSAPPAYRDDSTPESGNAAAGQGLARRMSKKEYATQLSRMMGDQLAAMSKAQARRGSVKA